MKSTTKNPFTILSVCLFCSFIFFQCKSPNITPKQTVRIQGLNDFNKQDFIYLNEIIKKCYDVDCQVINTSILIEPKPTLNCEDVNQELFGRRNFYYDYSSPIDIYLTNANLTSLGLDVCGVSFGNQIYLSSLKKEINKAVIIHELGHSFGLEHCSDKCLMNIDYNPAHLDVVWNSVNDLPVFCSSCKSKLPSKF